MAAKTGWSERFIVWELPLARLMAYEHALLRLAGGWPVAPGKITAVDKVLPPGFFDSAGEDDE